MNHSFEILIFATREKTELYSAYFIYFVIRKKIFRNGRRGDVTHCGVRSVFVYSIHMARVQSGRMFAVVA